MRVVIRDIPSEVLLQTISITPNKKDPDNTYLFRCYHCGTAITQVKGNVVSINAGLIPTQEVTTINQCHVCKENYTFQTVVAIPTIIKLTLSPQPDRLRNVSTFHCVICRTPSVQYNDELAVRLPLMQKMVLPKLFGCLNQSCGKDYLLNEVVYL